MRSTRPPRLSSSMFLSLALPLAFLFFNIFCPEKDPGHTTVDYLKPTTPENVYSNIQTLYVHLDRVEYDSTLAAGYVFRFQQSDISQGAPDSLTRAEEMNFAENLFKDGGPSGSPAASRIQLSLTEQSHGDDNRIGHAGWKRYVMNTQLAISFSDGTDIRVNSPAWFYFKQEPPGSPRWVLAEWADQPGNTAPVRLNTAGRVRTAALGLGVPPGVTRNP